MIRDAHWYAVATGERSSEGLVTDTAGRPAWLQALGGSQAPPGKSTGISLKSDDRLPSAEADLNAVGPAIYLALLAAVNGLRRNRAFFHKVFAR